MMIKNVKINKVYYSSNSKPPFYKTETIEAINKDGTIDYDGVKRKSTLSVAEGWYHTEDEAIDSMVEYWFTFKGRNQTALADIYQEFIKDMGSYIEQNRPEHLI